MNTPLCYMKANGTKNEKIESLRRSELDHLLSNFFLKACTKNGKEYEPATVFSFQHSIQRYLSEKKYPFNMLKDNGFEKYRKVLAATRKSLVFTSTARQQTASCSGHRRRRRGCPFWSRRIWRIQSSCAVVGFIPTLRFPSKRKHQSSNPLLSSTAPVLTGANEGSISRCT